MAGDQKRVPASFYRIEAGNEPVRQWLKELPKKDRISIGQDIKTLEFGWPIGMPLCRQLGHGLFEVRVNLAGKRISRVIFCIHAEHIVLLHGFVKKSQKTPKSDLELARKRKRNVEKTA